MSIFPLSLALSLICSAVFLALAWIRRQDIFLRSWLLAWLGLSLSAGLNELHWGLYAPFRHALNTTLLFWALSFLYLSAQQLNRVQFKSLIPPPASATPLAPPRNWPPTWFWLGGALWASLVLSDRLPHTPWLRLPEILAFLIAGMEFSLVQRRPWPQRFLGVAILFWGLAVLWRQGLVAAAILPAMSLEMPARTLLALCMLLVIYDEETRSAGRHLLALSNLQLRGHGAVRPEDLHGVLATLHKRVLSQFSRQALLWISPEFGLGSGSFYSGFSPGFLEYLHSTGAGVLRDLLPRFGGFLVLHDLRRPAELGALADNPEFQQLIRRLRAENMPGFTAVALQAHRQVQGLILIGHERRRGLLADEVRIVFILAGQLAVALENYRLAAESLRRGKEYELLTHVGTAISSILDRDSLFRMIHSELGKLMDVSNFYVAFEQPGDEEISFEFEIEHDVLLPSRQRPRAQGLTEFIIQTGRPLLIPRGVSEFLEAKGIQASGRPARCWMGVPILRPGRPSGVIALQNYDREDVFDAGHLRLLEIVAGQASVAMENARLFTEEQRSNRELQFLNRIAHIAISTFGPPQAMLQAVAQEIQAAFDCDYVALGLVGFRAAEVEFEAVAGRLPPSSRPPRLSLRQPPLSEAIHRRQPCRWSSESGSPPPTLHPQACSQFILPVCYAQQVLGILVLESRLPGAFPAEQVRTLQTLSDQLAAALNNIIIFQSMEQQAITDGLTGLKTRRFFMEALQAEWKRSARTGRPLTLLLLDLNNFKQLNDTLGHLEGDAALRRTARILEQKCRASNIIARFGGDEFTILLQETSKQQAPALVERLCLALEQDALLRERGLSASFGLASFPEDGATPEEVLRAADLDMYSAKHAAAAQGAGYRLRHTPPSLDSPASLDAALPGLLSLTAALDARDLLGPGHHERVAQLAWRLARALSLPEAEQDRIRLAGRLHDLGKCGFSGEFLRQPRLLAADWSLMRRHPALGAEMLRGLEGGEPIAAYVAAHHEWFNGQGYPLGLSGEAVPLGARMIALAEAYDAMTHPIPARQPVCFTPEAAASELQRLAAIQFDPQLVEAFLRLLRSPLSVSALSQSV